MSATVVPGVLTLACSSLPAPPLFWTDADGTRHGYEPDAAAAVAAAAGLELRWVFRQ
jgi:polar amino acid transport system substrate-binding protein